MIKTHFYIIKGTSYIPQIQRQQSTWVAKEEHGMITVRSGSCLANYMPKDKLEIRPSGLYFYLSVQTQKQNK